MYKRSQRDLLGTVSLLGCVVPSRCKFMAIQIISQQKSLLNSHKENFTSLFQVIKYHGRVMESYKKLILEGYALVI